MKKAEVIIGGGFGDEGKGLFTDYLAARCGSDACTIRFNGGAQAGHTVMTPDGKRHVFSHFGSGSFAGLPTYLSAFFVCSPVAFLREQAELAKLGIKPRLFADPNCPVTTPYDIMINQIAEALRGAHRHGSAGVGFGETIERDAHPAFALRLKDLKDRDALRQVLDAIRRQWVPQRLAALGVTEIDEAWQDHLDSNGIRERFLGDMQLFLEHIESVPLSYLERFDHLIFEGAQGLLLDQARGWFPHVTRSHTGIRNVLALAEILGLKELDAYYLTRPYTTRHGAGPLPYELPRLPYEKIVDPTNKAHPYQGKLRFAWFDLDMFRDTVLRDMADAIGHIELRPHLGMSCLDQIGDYACYVQGGRLRQARPEEFVELTRQSIDAENALAGFGPTRATVGALGKSVPHASLYGRKGAFQAYDLHREDAVVA